jgi:hypothetical protein
MSDDRGQKTDVRGFLISDFGFGIEKAKRIAWGALQSFALRLIPYTFYPIPLISQRPVTSDK